MAQMLSRHHMISFCRRKEPNFWCGTSNWKNDISSYHDLFDKGEGLLYGEASTSYTMLPYGDLRNNRREKIIFSKGVFNHEKTSYNLVNTNIYDLLHEYNNDLKIIYIVRSPFDRIVSAYNHYYQKHYINQGINSAIVKDRSLIDLTRYWTQISPYIKKFGKEQVLVVEFDRLKNDQDQLQVDLCNFLGLPVEEQQLAPSDEGRVHANKGNHIRLPYYYDRLPLRLRMVLKKIYSNRKSKHMKLTEASKKMITVMLEHEITELSNFMKKDLRFWFQDSEKNQ